MKKKLKKTIKKVLKKFGYQMQPVASKKQPPASKKEEKKLPYEMVGQAWSDSTKPLAFMFGFNPWKREHTSKFFHDYRTAYVFGSANLDRFSEIFKENKDFVFIIWGFKEPVEFLEYAKQNNTTVYRVEDGFVRSVGLGAAHTHPLSIIADSKTLYFDSREASDLEVILETTDFSSKKDLLEKAEKCMNMLINMGVSKYNHTVRTDVEAIYGVKTKKRILVIGQVEDDASIRYGCARKMTNNDLVRAAAEENPDAEIIYKPHPDVLGGFRKAYSNPMDVADIAKVVVEPLSLVDSFQTIDHVYTITSLAGFEALMRGLKVTCFGAPFYSGWGLTDDRQPCERRTSKRTVTEVFAAAYLMYPKYLNPDTDELIDLEEAILILKEMIVKNTFAQGMEQANEKQLDAAELLFRQAIAQTSNPDLTFKWTIELIKVLKEQMLFDDAFLLIKELFDQNEDSQQKALLYYHSASIYRLLGDYKHAYEDIQNAVSYNKNLNILNLFIELKWELEGISSELLDSVNEALSSSKDISQSFIKKYASIYCEAGQRTAAYDLLKKNNIPFTDSALSYLGLSVLNSSNSTNSLYLNNHSSYYQQLILNEGSFKDLVKNETLNICLVGPLVNGQYGEAIDKHDLVIRVGEYSADYPNNRAAGSKTNIWFKAKKQNASHDLQTKTNDLDLIIINENNPIYRKKNGASLFAHYLERNKRVEVYPSIYFRELINLLGHNPSEEIMAVYWLYKIKGPITKESVIGFSFEEAEKNLYQTLLTDSAVPSRVL
ncbi:capsular polysaccharide export protein, LipB/KpsS family [Peribacillus frigoritolerans]|uniref:capsular polysaccharide export protein, LipB/KpsS family n=1 Tax=Peribacillus frigoritolerans TaxID=450367 RepID=UPI001059690C|nr:hypothetical protein [Peribacillus frigoritolerans]TDL78970.1 hypothetical protein E2R53_16135 [Peribacillus frigoritolerans]